MSLEKCLEHISDEGRPLSHSVLIDLSDLAPAELGIFVRTWVKVGLERKADIIDRLVQMAEDSADLDFCAVLKLGLKDPTEAVRQKAITGLWEFEDRSLIPTLVDLLQGDSSGSVRASAAMALGKFASLAGDGKILSKDGELVKGCLMNALQDNAEWLEVRRRALESVAPFNTGDIAEFIQWAYDSDDLDLKCSSLYAMGRTGETEWLPMLFRELQNSRPPMRYEAAHACGELNEEEAAPHLIGLLHDDDLQVQLEAISALGKIGGPLAKKALRRCLKEGDPIVEDAAREGLESIQAMDDPLGFNSDL